MGRDQQTLKKGPARGRRSSTTKGGSSAIPATPDAAAPRGTPAIKTALRRGARQRRSGVLPSSSAAEQQQEELLPPELLQLVGGTLSTEDLKSASLVCRQWSRSLRGGVASLEAFLHENADANAAKARALTGALPHLSSLHINFGARSDAAALAPFFSAVGGAARLRDVRVTSWVPLAPQKGAAPLGCFATLALGGVTSLTFDGAALSSSDMLSVVNGAASATALQSLTLAPGAWPYFSQLAPFQAPAWLAPAHAADFTGEPRMSSIAAAALLTCKLPGLQRLAMGIDGNSQPEFFQSLRHMTALTALDLFDGAPVAAQALAGLAALPALRELKVQPAAVAAGADGGLEDGACGGLAALTQLRRLGVRLRSRPAEALCRDLLALTRRRAAPALVELELSRCVWSAEVGACTAALTALTRLRLDQLECVRPARASASASRAAMSVDLQPLMALRGMRAFELAAATGSIAGVVRGLGRLLAAWAPTLEDVRLADLSVAELDPWATLPALGACGALTSLQLLLREPMAPETAAVDVGALPPRLRQLALRNVVVTGDLGAVRGRMAALEALSLRQCTVVPGSVLPASSAGAGALRAGPLPAAPGGEVRGLVPLASALPALRSLELVALPHLADDDFAGIGRLTALTTLLVCASGTITVTHAALQALGGLKRLRQLRWHVGDVTDLLPDVAALRGLSALVALHLPSYLHGQFARWSAYNALPPLCDVHVEMPLP